MANSSDIETVRARGESSVAIDAPVVQGDITTNALAVPHPDTPNLAPRENVPLTLLRLAGPIIATMISHTVMSFVDFVMVSQLSTEAQAAIAPAGVVVWLVLCFGVGVLNAVNTFVSQSLGRGRLQDCSAYTWQGIHLAIILSIALAPLWWLTTPLYALVPHEPEVKALEIEYIQIRLLGLFPIIASVALSNFFNGVHRPGVQLFAVVLANIFNVAANRVLIFGLGTIPAMGIAGAAWATVAATIFHVAILFIVFMHPRFANTYATRETWRIHAAKLKRLLWYGLPIGVHSVAEVAGWTFFALYLVGRYSTEQLAANNICFKFNEISFMPAVGLSVALSAAVGKALGRKDIELARRYANWGLVFTLGYMSTVAITFAVFRYPLAGTLTDDPQVLAWAARIILCLSVFQVADAFHLAYSGVLKGAGDTHWPAWVGICGSLIFLVGGGLWISYMFPQLESLGPWIMAAVFIMILGVLFTLRYRGGKWQHMDILEKEADRELGG